MTKEDISDLSVIAVLVLALFGSPAAVVTGCWMLATGRSKRKATALIAAGCAAPYLAVRLDDMERERRGHD